MAVEYSFIVDSSMPVSAVTRLLVENLPLSLVAGGVPDTVVGDGIICTPLPQSELGRDLVYETFGITSAIKLVCRMDKFDLHEVGMNTLIDICMLFLSKCTCDLVLLSNGEKGLLLRKAGQLVVDCSDEYWRVTWSAVVADSGIAVTEGALPSL
jgi:hypothetical protein